MASRHADYSHQFTVVVVRRRVYFPSVVLGALSVFRVLFGGGVLTMEGAYSPFSARSVVVEHSALSRPSPFELVVLDDDIDGHLRATRCVLLLHCGEFRSRRQCSTCSTLPVVSCSKLVMGVPLPRPPLSLLFSSLGFSLSQVGVALSADSVFQQVSYVNAICTIKGGTHVECVANQVIAKLLPVLKRKNKSEVRLCCDWRAFVCRS